MKELALPPKKMVLAVLSPDTFSHSLDLNFVIGFRNHDCVGGNVNSEEPTKGICLVSFDHQVGVIPDIDADLVAPLDKVSRRALESPEICRQIESGFLIARKQLFPLSAIIQIGLHDQ